MIDFEATDHLEAPARVVYIHRGPGVLLSPKDAVSLIELIEKSSGKSLGNLPTAVESLLKRSAQSHSVLAYLTPEYTLKAQAEDANGKVTQRDLAPANSVLIGSAFLGNSTGILHDLAFDYSVIDKQLNEQDRAADYLTVQKLLKGHASRMVFAVSKSNDERKRKLYEELDFQLQEDIEGGAFYVMNPSGLFEFEEGEGPDIRPHIEEAESKVAGNESTEATSVEGELSDEELKAAIAEHKRKLAMLEELREAVSEGISFEVAPEVAAEIFGKNRTLLNDADSWGAEDTEVRSQASNALSKALLGEYFPTYGDKLSEEELERWDAKLKEAHDRFLSELQAAASGV